MKNGPPHYAQMRCPLTIGAMLIHLACGSGADGNSSGGGADATTGESGSGESHGSDTATGESESGDDGPRMDMGPGADLPPDDCDPAPDGAPTERTEWSETFDLGARETILDIAELASGELVVVGVQLEGSTHRKLIAGHDPEQGGLLWSLTLEHPPGATNGVGLVESTADGGFVVAGGYGDDAWVARFDDAHELVWERTIDTPAGVGEEPPPRLDGVESLLVEPGGTIAAAGASTLDDSLMQHWLLRLPADGSGHELVWSDTGFDPRPKQMLQFANGDFGMAGVDGYGGQPGDLWRAVTRISDDGATVWQTDLDPEEFVLGLAVSLVAPGQVMVAQGTGENLAAIDTTLSLLDEGGEEQWKEDTGYCEQNLPWGFDAFSDQSGVVLAQQVGDGDDCRVLIRGFDLVGEEQWVEVMESGDGPPLWCLARVLVTDGGVFTASHTGAEPDIDYMLTRIAL